MSRVRIFFAFLALAGLATALAACGGGGSSSSEDPQAVLEGATLKGIESADMELKLGIDASGEKSGHVEVELSGPFQSKGKGQLPELDLNAHVSASGEENFDKEFGLVLVPNQAFVGYEGVEYEVDPTTFSFIESAINRANSRGETTTEASTECQKVASELNIGDLLENATNEGSADVGGTETTKVSGDLKVPTSIDQLLKIVESPACASSLESAGPLPLSKLDEAKTEIEKALKTAHVDVYVGEDKIVRRVTGELTIEPEGSGEKVEFEIDLSFNGVNEEQEIEVPSGGKPLSALFQKLGVNPIELLEGLQSGQGLGLEGMLNEAAEGGSGL